MKQIFRNSTHLDKRSHDCLVCEIKGKKVKITYEAYNADEKCSVDIFDGYKWNHILSMLDMGIIPDRSAYSLLNGVERNHRSNELIKIAETLCNDIL